MDFHRLEGTGLVLRGLFTGRAAETACFDLFISIDDPDRDHGLYLDYTADRLDLQWCPRESTWLAVCSRVTLQI